MSQAPALEYFRQSLVPIRGSRAGSLLVLDVSLPPITRRQRENPWLARDRLGRGRQIAASGWKTYVGFIVRQPPIVRKTSRWMFAYRTGGHVMSVAPTLKRYLTAENIQYEE